MNESNNFQLQWLGNLGISLEKDTKKAVLHISSTQLNINYLQSKLTY